MTTPIYIVSVSGGKDSTAAALHLREQGIPFRAVFFELKLLSRDDNRVRALEALEFCVGWLAAERYAVRGHIIMRPPAFFRGNRADRIDTWCGKCRGTGILDGAACETCKGKGSRLEIPTIPIRARLEWAWTSRGGSQMRMDLPEDSGCMRWGMCDTAGDPD